MPYTVQSGDSWFSIAGKLFGDQRFFEALAAANGGISMLTPGQVINVPEVDLSGDPLVSQNAMIQSVLLGNQLTEAGSTDAFGGNDPNALLQDQGFVQQLMNLGLTPQSIGLTGTSEFFMDKQGMQAGVGIGGGSIARGASTLSQAEMLSGKVQSQEEKLTTLPESTFQGNFPDPTDPTARDPFDPLSKMDDQEVASPNQTAQMSTSTTQVADGALDSQVDQDFGQLQAQSFQDTMQGLADQFDISDSLSSIPGITPGIAAAINSGELPATQSAAEELQAQVESGEVPTNSQLQALQDQAVVELTDLMNAGGVPNTIPLTVMEAAGITAAELEAAGYLMTQFGAILTEQQGVGGEIDLNSPVFTNAAASLALYSGEVLGISNINFDIDTWESAGGGGNGYGSPIPTPKQEDFYLGFSSLIGWRNGGID